MLKTTLMAMAMLFLGTPGLAAAERQVTTASAESQVTTAAVRKAEPAETEQVAKERKRCGEICSLGDVPVYVPANRGSPAARLGGSTRGGSSRL